MPDGGVCHCSLDGGRRVGFTLTSPSGRLQATVTPSDGGGVTSLRVAGRELLYRADDFSDPGEGAWVGRAPLLWPAVGRNYTPAGLAAGRRETGWIHHGVEYPIPIHGFAMRRPWTPLDARRTARSADVVLGLADDDQTLAVYPFAFQLRVTHALDDAGLTSTVEVASPDDLPFCIGNHLTLALPPAPAFEQVRVMLPTRHRIGLTREGLLSDELTLIGPTATLAEDWLLNAVTGACDDGAALTLAYPDGLSVAVSQWVDDGADLVDPGARLWVFWGSRQPAFWCPEPWLGRPNSLQDGIGRIYLPAGRRFAWSMRVEVG